MLKSVALAVLAGATVAACGGSSTPTSPMSTTSITGTWVGTATDSSTAGLGSGGMMGQSGMGTMTWQLTQNGSNITGSMSFSGMPSTMMHGTVSGAMSGQDVTLTMDMPAGTMMTAGCSVHSTGTAHVDGAMMTMTGIYTGTNSCAGPFSNGQMTMTRR